MSEPWRDRETLKSEYIDKDKSQEELAEKWGCAQPTVGKWVVRHDLQKSERRPWNDKEALEEMYHGRRMSSREIAEEFGVESSTIRRSMKRLGVNLRDRHEAHKMGMWEGPATFTVDSDGYEKWRTGIDGETYHVYAHRLLAVAEHGVDDVAGRDVHHKNGIKWDNRPDNIEPISRSAHTKLHHRDGLYDDYLNELNHSKGETGLEGDLATCAVCGDGETVPGKCATRCRSCLRTAINCEPPERGLPTCKRE